MCQIVQLKAKIENPGDAEAELIQKMEAAEKL
jgi:hypothetical protein